MKTVYYMLASMTFLGAIVLTARKEFTDARQYVIITLEILILIGQLER